jgi:hypothetical protein
MNSIHSFTRNINNCKINVDVLNTCSAERAYGKPGLRSPNLSDTQILSKVLELLQPSYKAPFIFWVKE